MSDAMDPRHSGSAMPSGRWKARKVTTSDDIEAAARRVYAVLFEGWDPPYIWEGAAESTRNSCRRIAAAVLNVKKK